MPTSPRLADGAGNRFVLWDLRGQPAMAGSRDAPITEARELLARFTLPEAGDVDGLLLVEDGPEGTIARMVVINRDGSRAEMCGNGLRCVAAHIGETTDVPREFTVATDAGPLACRCEEGRAQVSLGRPKVGQAFEVEFDGVLLPGFAVDVGVPHAALDGSGLGVRLEEAPLAEVAAAVLATGLFPEGVNVELALNHGDEIVARVHERGVGETLACGTGAGALAAVGFERLGLGPPLAIRMPGGRLEIDVDDGTGEYWLGGAVEFSVIAVPRPGAVQ